MALASIEQKLRRWNPLHAVLVAGPDDAVFRVPPSVPELGGNLLEAMHRRLMRATIAYEIGMAAILCLGIWRRDLSIVGWAVVVGLLGVSFWHERARGLATIHSLSERAEFCYWVRYDKRVRRGWWLSLTFVTLLGVGQLALMQGSDIESLVQRYGLMYEPALNGESWRLLTGPLLHSGVPHWLTNATFMVLLAPLAWAVYGWRTVLIFELGNLAGIWMQHSFGPAHMDAYLGISAGLFALMGALLASAYAEPQLLPKGFRASLIWVALISAVGAPLTNPDAAAWAHAGGFFAGAVIAFALSGMRSRDLAGP